jgi:hypothetical protein
MSECRANPIIYYLMGSLSNTILLVLINSCDLSLNYIWKQYEFHLFSYLLRDLVEIYSSTLLFGAFIMVKEEPCWFHNKFLLPWDRNDLNPASEVINNSKLVLAAIKAFIKQPCNINMEEFYYIFPSSTLSQASVWFFNYLSLEAWVTWLTQLNIPDAISLLLKLL